MYLFRFCGTDYYPFDATVKEKYVVTDDYTPIWEVRKWKKSNSPLLNGYKSKLKQYWETILSPCRITNSGQKNIIMYSFKIVASSVKSNWNQYIEIKHKGPPAKKPSL